MKKTRLIVGLLSASLVMSLIPAVVSAAAKKITIDTTNFEDPNFVTYLKKIEKNTDNGYDADGAFSEDELLKLTSIKPGANVTSLKGIEKLTHVTSVNINGNQNITSLDLSSNTKMKKVYATNSSLEELNVTGCKKITKIDLTGSKIKSLDISDCTDLNYLDVSNTGNAIKEINIANQNKLVETAYDGNYELLAVDDGTYKFHEFTMQVNSTIRTLRFDENTDLKLVRINDVNFPDSVFASIVNDFDSDQDNYISWNEKEAVKNLSAVTMNITSLKGIEYFDKLESIIVHRNKCTELDVSRLSELKVLVLDDNKNLSSLDVSNNTKLERLSCNSCDLKELNIGNKPNLKELNCEGNNLTSLDISLCPVLYDLDCSGNDLTQLDVSTNLKLHDLDCAYNELGELDFSKNTLLSNLRCYNNGISSLNLENNRALSTLYCDSNDLSVLDLSNNTSMSYLSCDNNKLDSLDVSNLNLRHLSCSVNNITELDLSSSKNLTYLGCAVNKLTSLNVTNCSYLYEFYCQKNELTSLDLSTNYRLGDFCCYSNHLSELDLSKNTNLNDVECYENELTSLILPENTRIYSIECESNKLTSIDVSKCPNLKTLICADNLIKNLDFSYCPELRELDCSNNEIETIIFASEQKYLYSVDCQGNKLKKLDVSGFGYLGYLMCYDNDIREIDVTNTRLSSGDKRNIVVDSETGYEYMSYHCDREYFTSYLNVDLDTNVVGLQYYPHDSIITPSPTPTTVPIKPTAAPENTTTPTVAPTNIPSVTPSQAPTSAPTVAPGGKPTVAPTVVPTIVPDEKPTVVPSIVPDGKPTAIPTSEPTKEPATNPTATPTEKPVADPTAEPTLEPTKAPSVEDFAERLYTTCLGREAEEAGKDYWVSELKAGKPGSEVAEGFFFSPEYENRKLDNKDFIGTLYATFMNRTPADEEVDYWSSEMDNGKTRKDIFDGFVNSPEWADICLTYGIRSGGLAKPTFEKEASAEVKAFAERLYTTCLGREAEKEGLEWWAAELANLRQTGTVAAQGFFYSPEFISLKTSDDEYVTRLYRTFMGREPEEDGFEFWTSELKAGKGRDYVFNGFSVAPEFANLCADAGIMR